MTREADLVEAQQVYKSVDYIIVYTFYCSLKKFLSIWSALLDRPLNYVKFVNWKIIFRVRSYNNYVIQEQSWPQTNKT